MVRMFADRFADRLRFEIDPNWAGELPLTLLIAKDGKTTSALGTVDFATIRSWLDAQQGSRPAFMPSARALCGPAGSFSSVMLTSFEKP
jgi:hypothetical protein